MSELVNSRDNLDVDWHLIKDILCGVASALKMVCDMLPGGIWKNIICGMASVLMTICNQIPLSDCKDKK